MVSLCLQFLQLKKSYTTTTNLQSTLPKSKGKAKAKQKELTVDGGYNSIFQDANTYTTNLIPPAAITGNSSSFPSFFRASTTCGTRAIVRIRGKSFSGSTLKVDLSPPPSEPCATIMSVPFLATMSASSTVVIIDIT